MTDKSKHIGMATGVANWKPFFNCFILKYHYNVILLGNYLQDLHDDTTDEKN